MHDQPKYRPLRYSKFFQDRSSARQPVQGTVARGFLNDDVYFATGRDAGADPKAPLGDRMPFPASKEVLLRGQNRYQIYCTPCHSAVGDGNGMIVMRGYRRPPSFHEPRLRQAPLGHYFDVISHGFGAMPDYAAQLEPRDRWAVAAYIRALQVSQNGSVNDVPADMRDKIQNLGQLQEKVGKSTTEPTMPEPAGKEH